MKFDANAPAIRAALLAKGCTVEYIIRAPGPGLKGVPDLLVGYRGVNLLMEVKVPGQALTNDQPAWFASWRGAAHVVHSAEEALAVLRQVHGV